MHLCRGIVSISVLVIAAASIALPALAQGAWKVGDRVWGRPSYEQWSDCTITKADINTLVDGGMQYSATCQIISNGKYVPEDEILTQPDTAPWGGPPPPEAGGVAHVILAAAPRPSLNCASVRAGRPGAPDPAIVRGLIQCRMETAITTGQNLVASPLSIRYLKKRPWKVGYAYRGMQGGQGGDFGGGGPGTTVYLYQVDATVTDYSSSGVFTTPRHETWECFYAQHRWTCGIGS